MSRSHQRQVRGRKGRAAPLALAAVILMMPPSRIGSREAAVPAAEPAAGGSFHFLASPFGTIHAATFRFSQPVGTEIPASSGLHHAVAYAPDGDGPSPALLANGREDVEVNRSLKGPRLVPRARQNIDTAPAASRENAESANPPSSGPPSPDAGTGGEAPAARAKTANAGPPPDDAGLDVREDTEPRTPGSWPRDGAVGRVMRIYFATTPLNRPPAAISPWPLEAPPPDSLSYGEGREETLPEPPNEPEAMAEVPDVAAPSGHNETIAPKGEVTGEGRRPKSPAELLGLTGAARAKHEKCLANAIYFEARGEPVRGQMAVAQVVINRVFSGYYPDNVCGVVYQNTRRHRHLRCQFSFTCDGIPDRVTEPDAWDRATRIARDTLDGNFWLNDIGKATHYHARWVHPWWVHEMRRLDRIGVHTFYRPRKWGDGAGSPAWGDATAKL